MFEMFMKLIGPSVALALLAATMSAPSELFDRAKSGPSVGRTALCDAQMTPPAVFTAGGEIYAERAGFEPALQVLARKTV